MSWTNLRWVPWLFLAALPLACADDETFVADDAGALDDAGADASADLPAEADLSAEAEADAEAEAEADGEEDVPDVPPTCGFDYESSFVHDMAAPAEAWPASSPLAEEGIAQIAHAEPPPPYTYVLTLDRTKGPKADIVMPGYSDSMPLFARGAAWTDPTRCYETPLGVQLLTEDEAWDLYRRIAELTTGVAMDPTPGVRTVVGLRGAYPGTFSWHGNLPDRFNDTLVLLWVDAAGARHVREFPVNTDTGAYDFGVDSSSSLRANRRYRYLNGWHSTYNALHIDEDGYRVADDTNHNGHWDSDRNGWLPPLDAADHFRAGGGHNIHMGSVDPPLGTAAVYNWSAGCQVIPGMADWTEFITNAWTNEGDPVSYFLVDVRDIAPEVWRPCTPDGTHACPYRIDALPYAHSADTTAVATSDFDVYNCSAADESGPEVVYLLFLDRSGTLSVSVDCTDPVDLDVHLLDGDDPQACLARDHIAFDYAITPGRYLIVADTFASGGTPLAGPYTLHVSIL